ncbi:MAG: glycosyltransferase, partial [Nodosilinea sp.]
MNKGQNFKRLVHFWVPNLFEFKGGIQVYLCDVLCAIACLNKQERTLSNIDVLVADKLDVRKPEHLFEEDFFSFTFSGWVPNSLRTLFFSAKILSACFQQRPALVL